MRRMSGGACLSEAGHQRSWGELRLSFKRRGADTVLDGLRQDGCLKARFPRAERGAWAAAVTLNSSGGVAGGDRLATCIGVGAGASATVASQAAERFYRALPGAVATVETNLRVAEGAALEWLPQESILFDRCAVRRALRIELAGDAWFLGVESLVFGRTAMGEEVHRAGFRDLIEVRREGRLLLHDAIRFDGEVQAVLARPASGGGGRAVATLVHAGPDVEALVGPMRAGLGAFEAGMFEAGASAWDGMLVVRIVAVDGACLRRAVVAGLGIVRGGRPLPRVWLC